MLVRALGLVLLIAGVASILTIALPSITGIPFSSTISTGVNNLIISDNNGVYLVSSVCTSIPSAKAYKTYVSIRLETRQYPGINLLRIKNPSLVRLHLYTVTGATGYPCTGPGPLPQRVESFKELDDAIKASLSTRIASGQRIVVYHNLPPRASVDVTSLGGGTSIFVIVYYLPVDSFDVLTAQGQLLSGRQALQQALNARQAYNNPLLGTPSSMSVVLRIKLSPIVTWLSYARALSIIVLGLLVIAVDAGLHPEYYRGRWRVFRRLAEMLGFEKNR